MYEALSLMSGITEGDRQTERDRERDRQTEIDRQRQRQKRTLIEILRERPGAIIFLSFKLKYPLSSWYNFSQKT